MDDQNIYDEGQQMQPSREDISKQKTGNTVNPVVKEIGKKALEAHGVPPGLSDLAVKKIANTPLVKNTIGNVPPINKTNEGNESSPNGDVSNTEKNSPSKPLLNAGLGGLSGLGGGSNDGEPSNAERIAKARKYWKIITALAPAFGYFLIGLLIILIIMVPILFIQDKIEQIGEGLDKFINFITGEGWQSSEVLFFETLQEEYNRYDRLNYKEDEFDIPLIAATVHFSTVVNPDSYTYNGDDKNTDYTYDNNNPEIPGNQLRSFYVKANNELGSAWTLIPGQQKLIGHLIDTKFSYDCIAFPSGWEVFNPDAWEDVFNAGIYAVQDFWNQLTYTVDDTASDIVKKSNILKLIQLITGYNKQGGKGYFETEIRQLGYEFKNDNIFGNIVRMIENSDEPPVCGEKQFAVPVLRKFINYEYYKQYLKEDYLKRQPYATCATCEYENASPERKEEILDEWIQEIFDQRDAYNYLRGTPSDREITEFIPGMSSLPIQIGAGEDWKKFTSRGYQLHTAKCFKNGVATGANNCDHLGIDFNVAYGTPVVAIANGVVVKADYIAAGYGNYVKLGHDIDGDGTYDYYSLYAHMSKITVNVDSRVGGGQKVGEVGSTGNSTGPHLHFEIRDRDDKIIDPTPILNGIQNGNSPLNPIAGAMTCNMFTSEQIAARNKALATAIKNAGYATREGVVAAATYLTADIGVVIPYWYGGKYKQVGINSEWGCPKAIVADPGTDKQPTGTTHPYGLDCSGFVSWALRNGGYKSSTIPEGSDAQGRITDDKIKWDANSINYVRPGDLAWNSEHIGIIISVDKNKCEYQVAEARGASYGVVITKNTCTSGRFTHIILMDDYYNNQANKEA